MSRDSVEAGGHDRFSCSTDAWELLLDLGNAFGWKPVGTRYVPTDIANLPDDVLLHGYRPGAHQDSKCVVADDALAWARALHEARNSPHLTSMIGDRPQAAVLRREGSVAELQSVNAPFSVTMDEFIEYAFGGAFSFALAE